MELEPEASPEPESSSVPTVADELALEVDVSLSVVDAEDVEAVELVEAVVPVEVVELAVLVDVWSTSPVEDSVPLESPGVGSEVVQAASESKTERNKRVRIGAMGEGRTFAYTRGCSGTVQAGANARSASAEELARGSFVDPKVFG